MIKRSPVRLDTEGLTREQREENRKIAVQVTGDCIRDLVREQAPYPGWTLPINAVQGHLETVFDLLEEWVETGDQDTFHRAARATGPLIATVRRVLNTWPR